MQARSSIARNSASAVNAQQVFKSTFDALINKPILLPALILKGIRASQCMHYQKWNFQ